MRKHVKKGLIFANNTYQGTGNTSSINISFQLFFLFGGLGGSTCLTQALHAPQLLERAQRIAAALGGTKLVILRSHGLLTVGASIDEAREKARRAAGALRVGFLVREYS